MFNIRIVVGGLTCLIAGILQLKLGPAGAVPALIVTLLPYIYDMWQNYRYGFIEKVMKDIVITKRDVDSLYDKIMLAVDWQKEHGYEYVYLAFIQDMEGEADCIRLLGAEEVGAKTFDSLMVSYKPHDMFSLLSACHATIMNVLGNSVVAIKFSPTTEKVFKKLLA